MTLLCAGLAMGLMSFSAAQESETVRKKLPNGASLVVATMPRAKTVSVQLFAAAKGVQESQETHGWRHLLEHMLVRQDGKIDRDLETQGCFLQAETHREAMQITIDGPPAKLPEMMAALLHLIQSFKAPAKEALAREVGILEQEIALQSSVALERIALWNRAYPNGGLDPVGSVEMMRKATPQDILNLFKRHFAVDNLTISVAGRFAIAEVEALSRPLDKAAPASRKAKWTNRTADKFGIASASPDIASLKVPPYSDPKTAGALILAFAYASECERPWFVYTPSAMDGLVLAGGRPAPEFAGGFGAFLSLGPRNSWNTGREFAKSWLGRIDSSPRESAFWNGILMCQSSDANPELLRKNLATLSAADLTNIARELAAGAKEGSR